MVQDGKSEIHVNSISSHWNCFLGLRSWLKTCSIKVDWYHPFWCCVMSFEPSNSGPWTSQKSKTMRSPERKKLSFTSDSEHAVEGSESNEGLLGFLTGSVSWELRWSVPMATDTEPWTTRTYPLRCPRQGLGAKDTEMTWPMDAWLFRPSLILLFVRSIQVGLTSALWYGKIYSLRARAPNHLFILVYMHLHACNHILCNRNL